MWNISHSLVYWALGSPLKLFVKDDGIFRRHDLYDPAWRNRSSEDKHSRSLECSACDLDLATDVLNCEQAVSCSYRHGQKSFPLSCLHCYDRLHSMKIMRKVTQMFLLKVKSVDQLDHVAHGSLGLTWEGNGEELGTVNLRVPRVLQTELNAFFSS